LNSSSAKCTIKSDNTNLRWDRANTDDYYYLTGDLLYPIYDEIVANSNCFDADCNNVKVCSYNVLFDFKALVE
jgi:hypothetical protein